MVIAVDFDGTLFETDFPTIGKPKWKVINWCKEQQKQGNHIILWSCREGEALQEALQACRNVGLEFDAVNSNLQYRIDMFSSDCRKIGADLYLDDKNIKIEDIT